MGRVMIAKFALAWGHSHPKCIGTKARQNSGSTSSVFIMGLMYSTLVVGGEGAELMIQLDCITMEWQGEW